MVIAQEEKKEVKKSFWDCKVEEIKGETGWHFFVGKNILVRRIPNNFEVVYKKHPVSCYYPSMHYAMKYVLRCMIENKMKKKDTVEKVLEEMEKLHKFIEKTFLDIKASIEDYMESENVGRARKDIEKYYCTVCKRNHLINTTVGKNHVRFGGKK